MRGFRQVRLQCALCLARGEHTAAATQVDGTLMCGPHTRTSAQMIDGWSEPKTPFMREVERDEQRAKDQARNQRWAAPLT